MKFKKDTFSLPFDLLIFDMDGVLIDVSMSYRKAIQQTVRTYLETCLGARKSRREWITKQDVSLFKSAGGFNNDWDLTSGLLLYLLSVSQLPPSSRRNNISSIQEGIDHLKARVSAFRPDGASLIEKKNLSPFIEAVKSFGGGLRGVRLAIRKDKKASWDGWVYRSGDLDKQNLVKRIFQELYLGDQFASHYHLQPLFYRGPGYYRQEKLLIPKNILTSLHGRTRLGIASGRPRFEADLALKKFNLLPYFDSVVTLDECEREEGRLLKRVGKRVKCSKPHPFSILRVARESGIRNPRCGYIGDVVDDMRAARSARKELQIAAIGFVFGQTRRKGATESLLASGADAVIQDPRDLLRLIT
jgi:HAD superfamily phosphatase